MANFENLKTQIQAVIRENGNNEITGVILQQALIAMISSLGNGYLFKGTAAPTDNPGTPDQNVVYLTATAGTYTNFGGLTVDAGKLTILAYNGTWIKFEIDLAEPSSKEGVISQTQTWTRAADGGYDYVMSDLVYGNIPRANIDLFVAAGATFNATSGYFELNGLTDLSYEEMQKIYAQYTPNPWTSQMALAFVGIRTNITPANSLPNYVVQGGVRLCYESFDLERVSVISADYVAKFNNLQFAFYYLEKLNTINGVLDVSGMTAFTLVFSGAKSLESVQMKTLKASVSFSDSPRLSNASILYMINNEAATRAITITLHATAYARATADADITAALQNHPNVTLASA